MRSLFWNFTCFFSLLFGNYVTNFSFVTFIESSDDDAKRNGDKKRAIEARKSMGLEWMVEAPQVVEIEKEPVAFEAEIEEVIFFADLYTLLACNYLCLFDYLCRSFR